jgi:hypothetical protein
MTGLHYLHSLSPLISLRVERRGRAGGLSAVLVNIWLAKQLPVALTPKSGLRFLLQAVRWLGSLEQRDRQPLVCISSVSGRHNAGQLCPITSILYYPEKDRQLGDIS